MPCSGDTNSHQHRAVHHLICVTNMLITGIQNQVKGFFQWAGTPGLQSLIEQVRAAADLRARDTDFWTHLFCNTAAKCIDGGRWCKLVLDLLVLQIFFWRL